jgi:biopolymer transport protein ExbB
MNSTKYALLFVPLWLVVLCGGVAVAQDSDAPVPPPIPANIQTLDQLLQEVQRSISIEGKIDQDREAEFKRDHDQQQRLLTDQRNERIRQEQRSDRLKNEFDENERALEEIATLLNERMGNLGEMFGVVRQVAGDATSTFENSLTSSQIPNDRIDFLADLAQRKALPTIPELEGLWYEIQREIVESGRVVTFNAPVREPNGEMSAARSVTRVGVFNAVSDGEFLVWDSLAAHPALSELKRQPSGRYRGMASDLEDADPGTFESMAIDPTRGVLLSRVVEAPTLKERIQQGKLVGYVIIVIGAVGLALAAFRWWRLASAARGIKRQLKAESPDAGNPLGRVMMVYTENAQADVETLELKMDEAIMKETSPLEKGLSTLKVMYVVAPLLGLLGTVTGMIETFQMITLFGTGDPKMMAGGISQALVTTVLGLTVAIPLTFLHSILSSMSQELIRILEEQSAGIVALLAERR